MAGKDFITSMRRRAEEAEEQLREAVEALRFYADMDVYVSGTRKMSTIAHDIGGKARAALAKIEGDRNA